MADDIIKYPFIKNSSIFIVFILFIFSLDDYPIKVFGLKIVDYMCIAIVLLNFRFLCENIYRLKALFYALMFFTVLAISGAYYDPIGHFEILFRYFIYFIAAFVVVSRFDKNKIELSTKFIIVIYSLYLLYDLFFINYLSGLSGSFYSVDNEFLRPTLFMGEPSFVAFFFILSLGILLVLKMPDSIEPFWMYLVLTMILLSSSRLGLVFTIVFVFFYFFKSSAFVIKGKPIFFILYLTVYFLMVLDYQLFKDIDHSIFVRLYGINSTILTFLSDFFGFGFGANNQNYFIGMNGIDFGVFSDQEVYYYLSFMGGLEILPVPYDSYSHLIFTTGFLGLLVIVSFLFITYNYLPFYLTIIFIFLFFSRQIVYVPLFFVFLILAYYEYVKPKVV